LVSPLFKLWGFVKNLLFILKVCNFTNDLERRDFPEVILEVEVESVSFELLAEVFGSHVEVLT
jgi:hypothetical protein